MHDRRNVCGISFRLRLWTAVAIALAAAGCARIQVDSFQHPTVDFTELAGWAWSPDTKRGPFDVEFTDPRYEAAIRDGIAAALGTKGYAESTPESADFLVSYRVVRRGKEASSPVNDTSNVPENWYSQADDQVSTTADTGGSWTAEYDEAELRVDVMLRARKIMAWRGKATTEVIYTKPTERRLNRVKKAVRLVMEEFPARPGAGAGG